MIRKKMQFGEYFYLYIILLSILFYIVSNLSERFAIATIILILVLYFVYHNQNQFGKFVDVEQTPTNIKNGTDSLDKEIKDRTTTVDKLYTLHKIPKSLKYLKENSKLVEILTNIHFIRTFDKTRYSDVLLSANLMMKIYIYILSSRYDSVYHITSFVDARDNTIELLYSVIIIVPQNMRHIYGFNPYEEIHKTIDEFTTYSREMLTILEKFIKIHEKEIYIPETKYKPYNSVKQISFP